MQTSPQSNSVKLERSLGPLMVWGLGVGYVISGMYFGWNLGLAEGGTYGLAIATFFIIIMYVTFTFSYTELACAIPKAGGAFDYAERSLGKYFGFFAGMAQNIEFIFAPPAIAAAPPPTRGRRRRRADAAGAAAAAAAVAGFLMDVRRLSLKFQQKLLISYLVVSAVPVLLLAEGSNQFSPRAGATPVEPLARGPGGPVRVAIFSRIRWFTRRFSRAPSRSTRCSLLIP